MLKVFIYVMYDRVAQESGPVWEAKNDGVAVRGFNQMLEKSRVPPEEYRLLRVASMDKETNEVTPVSPAVEVELRGRLPGDLEVEQ